MLYVSPGQPSTRARMLAGELGRTIEQFQRQYPDTKPADVAQALLLTQTADGTSAHLKTALVIGGLIAALLAGVLLWLVRS